MTYTANKKTYSLLESLAYWRAELAYCREKDPDDIGFLNKADKTIHFLFNQLDRAGVPFWAQNSALAIGENWREYERRNLSVLFANKGILEG